jgi:hypothetical protein
MPEGKKALIDHIGNIQPEAPRAGMQTFVHHAVAQMTDQVKEQNGLVLAWTDGYDEKKGKQEPLPENHAPITIVVPKAKFLPKAESVKSTLGKKDVNVLVAANSTEFGGLLDKFVSKLDKDAEQKAKVDAEKQYDTNSNNNPSASRNCQRNPQNMA